MRAPEDYDKFNKEKFIKNGAKEFIGGVDPIMAENWINNMETTFRAMQVPHRHITRLSTTMLQDEAYHWWQSMDKTAFIRRDINSVTWSEFVTAFNEQYFPEPVIQQKALEFNNLNQGSEKSGSMLEDSCSWKDSHLDLWIMKRQDAANSSGLEIRAKG